jgi:outer membrane lipoprotein SlyB
MKRFALLLLLLATTAAFAQAPTRVRGTITSLDGDVLSVNSREGKELKIQLAPDAQVALTKKASAADFKPGAYVGVTSVKGPDGRLVARRVHALGPQVPQMHAAWDSIPDSMMTNATLDATAQVGAGTELVLKNKDGEQKILVTPQTEYYTFAPGTRADLKPGESIFTGAAQKDGKLVAQRITVSKDGVKPPQ